MGVHHQTSTFWSCEDKLWLSGEHHGPEDRAIQVRSPDGVFLSVVEIPSPASLFLLIARPGSADLSTVMRCRRRRCCP
jgi:hypothetical protein